MLETLDTLIAFAVIMLGVSLIITILTQIVASFLALRGSNLLWGVETLLHEVDPTLEAKLTAADSNVHNIAHEILTDRFVSDSTFSRAGGMWLVGPIVGLLGKVPGANWLIQRWRYATAIRPQELARMIEKNATALTAAAGAAAGGGGAPATLPRAAAAAALADILSAPDPETARKLSQLNKAVTAFIPLAPVQAAAPRALAIQVDKIFQQATDVAQRSLGKLETSFDTVMDRVSQRFALEMRLWTVLFAFVVAFGVHLDSFRLLDQLSTNANVRAALSNMRDSMLTEAGVVLPAQGAPHAAGEVPVSTKILNEALVKLKNTDATLSKVGPIPDNTTTVADAVDWLAGQTGGAGKGDAYRRVVVSVLRAHAVDINQRLSKAGIDLIRTPYGRLFQYAGKREFLGTLIAAALLSLGAPFWYNALKNLSNLRTIVASRQAEQEPAAS